MKKTLLFSVVSVIGLFLAACNTSIKQADQSDGDYTPQTVNFSPSNQQGENNSPDQPKIPVDPGREQNIFTDDQTEKTNN